jgi:sugar phosphate isomerase/epimerase
MNASSLTERLAVCSWSLQPESPLQLIDRLKDTGLSKVQIALDPIRSQPAAWGGVTAAFRENGLAMVSGMMVTEGEDYSTMETIKATGGVVPDATWDENWKNFQANASLAQQLGLKLVTLHAGFLPEDKSDPMYKKLADRLALTVDLFADHGIEIGLETGQETAEHLLEFLESMKRSTVGANFDPANMILYDKGDPIEALRKLGPWVKQCHIKDATKTKEVGTWGVEVPAGAGEVDWAAFFRTVDEIRYQGLFAIEREAGDQRLADIKTARRHVEEIVSAS